ncbi:MAG: endonuclease III [Dehalococcoidia bacterium]|nr:endonuclease III [Dehalococcoidia bacterium]
MPIAKLGASVYRLNDLLIDEYGHHEWRPHRDPLSELVLTILSQHTSDINSGRAFSNLVERFENWEDVRDADPLGIASAINCAGLGQIKSVRIKAILEEITSRLPLSDGDGRMDISFLAQLPMVEAKAWLRSLPGVGPKTAACVLLFSLQQPALPVDTHVHRLARRLGLVDAKASPERTQDELEALVPPESVYEFHINLIAHGRRVCKSQRPRCGECILAGLCPSYGVVV